MSFFRSKMLWLGFGAAVVALFVYEAMTGQLPKNTAVFNPASYK